MLCPHLEMFSIASWVALALAALAFLDSMAAACEGSATEEEEEEEEGERFQQN